MKNNKGITLIALVITIIVLLILAGVSIAMLTSDQGIISKSNEATAATKLAEAEEAVKIAIATIITENEGKFVVSDTTELKGAIEKANTNATVTVDANETDTDLYDVSVSVKGGQEYKCTVNKTNGTIKEITE